MTDSHYVIQSSSTNTDEFDGMNFSSVASRIGLMVNNRFNFKRFHLTLCFTGEVGFTSRMNLTIGPGAWEDKLYGFVEIGAKFSYNLERTKTQK